MKLAGTLLVPLAALVGVTILEMAATADERDEVHDQAELATFALGPPSVLNAIKQERNFASTYLLGSEDAVALTVEDNGEARAITDRAVEDFRATIEGRDDAVARAYGPSLDALASLDELRAEVDSYEGERSVENNAYARVNFDGYSEVMQLLFAANDQVVTTIENPELRQGAELADLSAEQADLTARLVRSLLNAAIDGDRDGVNRPQEISEVSRLLGELRANEQLIDTKAEGRYRPLADDVFAADEVREFPQVIDSTLQTGRVDLGLTLSTSTGDEPGRFGYTVFSNAVDDELQAQAGEVRASADARLRNYGILAALAVVAAGLSTWFVSRSITRPLRSLTRQAKDMAERRLPGSVGAILETPLGENVTVPELEPVVVQTRDEVADVAEALNTVQETALDLAVEQAVLRRNIADSFVNLARRNQNLLGRQLDFITELESNETDPDTLGSLFRLDHLATRMRRNAESLLVLAGIEPPRKWAAPVRLGDVIRAALGEVEDYQRVSVREVETATILGSAAADLAHLIAEFVENALSFSPPDRNVEVRGRRDGDGFLLAVIDMGFGMIEADLEAANRRLAGTESFTIAPSKYLGHYVAGNLAARHGIRLALAPTPGGGITATIVLPPGLLTPDAASTDAAAGAPALHAVGVGLPGNGAGPMAPAVPAGTEAPGAASVTPDPSSPPPPGPPLPTGPATAGGDAGPGAPPVAPLPAVAVTNRTANGLTKRVPLRDRAAAAAGPSAAVPDDDLLTALRQHSHNLGSPSRGRPGSGPPGARRPSGAGPVGGAGRGPSTPPPNGGWPAPTGPPLGAPPGNGSPPTTAAGLARRVPGAQLPRMAPLSIRRSETPAGTTPGTPEPRPAAPPPPRGDDVYGLLTTFTTGVQRGLDESTGQGGANERPDDEGRNGGQG